MPRGLVFVEVVIPALLLAGRDRARHEISEADHQYVLRTIRALIDDAPDGGVVGAADAAGAASTAPEIARPAPQRVLGVSARTLTDETIWDMLAQLFDPKKVAVESVGSAYLASEATAEAAAENELPDLVCVISIPPGGLAQARYICRRLRAKLPVTPILVIRPGVQANGKESAQKLTDDGASQVCFTLEDAHTAVERQLAASSVGATKIAPVSDAVSATGA
jgi:hypothetical protein